MSQQNQTPEGAATPEDTTPDVATPTETPEEVVVEESVAAPAAAAPAAPAADQDDEDTFVLPAGTVVTAGPGLAARLGAEAFGTFFLVLVGVGIALYSAFSNVGGGLGVALGFGVAVLAGIVAVGHVSGGHFNPAVTFGACLAGRTPFADLLPYWLAQVVGGALAAAVLFLTVPSGLPGLVSQGEDGSVRAFFSGTANGFGEHSPLARLSQGGAEFGLVAALLVEVIGTAVFVGVILGATDRRANKQHVPFAVGLTLTVVLLLAMPVTNASINPARSLAAAIFSDSWALQQVWLFWVAPLFGAAIAALVYRAFAAEPVEDSLFAEDELYVAEDDVVVVER
ncbi:MIP family channel protein [Cellulomonas flavigena DSM 20109]|uniref:MIP family channel protein n=1 Tax=Cellulomonas flavigena (strain ATCC 482 / DSM 20109 / BCRC 11376 / JCM 18109 / NBRC 3775 / NCIMB 8073 / NRS 134) TaxID=446466 RepID=D5UI72_CELFN|nr:aquaporin [Cellulomonas flavigena]ADG75417.1 MIP family channel protein [Cellulomonas flavigena DSM 20109]